MVEHFELGDRVPSPHNILPPCGNIIIITMTLKELTLICSNRRYNAGSVSLKAIVKSKAIQSLSESMKREYSFI